MSVATLTALFAFISGLIILRKEDKKDKEKSLEIQAPKVDDENKKNQNHAEESHPKHSLNKKKGSKR